MLGPIIKRSLDLEGTSFILGSSYRMGCCGIGLVEGGHWRHVLKGTSHSALSCLSVSVLVEFGTSVQAVGS